jgi:hypothetical protein
VRGADERQVRPERRVVQAEPVARVRAEIRDDIARPGVPANARGLRGEKRSREEQRDTARDRRVRELGHTRLRPHDHDDGDDGEREQEEVRVVLAREERQPDPYADDRGWLPVRVAEVPEGRVQREQHREHHHELQDTELVRDERQRHHQRATERRGHEPDADPVQQPGGGDAVQRERAEQDQGVGDGRADTEQREEVEDRAGQRLLGKRERPARRRKDGRVPVAAPERSEAPRAPLQRPEVEARDGRDRVRTDGQLAAHPPDERPRDRDGDRAQADRAPDAGSQGPKATRSGGGACI